jgi:hypothetical protein
VVKVTLPNVPGFAFYVTGITDNQKRTEFEQYMRDHKSPVTEVSAVPNEAQSCNLKLDGYNAVVANENGGNTSALAVSLICGAANNGTVATTATPSPKSVPFTPIVLTGTGSKVTESFELPAGQYKVTWAAHSANQYGVTTAFLAAYMIGHDKTPLMGGTDLNGSTSFQSDASGGQDFFNLQVTESNVTDWQFVIEAVN